VVSCIVAPHCRTVSFFCDCVGVHFIYPIAIGAGQDRSIIHCQIIGIDRNVRFIQCVFAPFAICQNPSHLSDLPTCRIYAVLQLIYNRISSISGVLLRRQRACDISDSEAQEYFNDPLYFYRIALQQNLALSLMNFLIQILVLGFLRKRLSSSRPILLAGYLLHTCLEYLSQCLRYHPFFSVQGS